MRRVRSRNRRLRSRDRSRRSGSRIGRSWAGISGRSGFLQAGARPRHRCENRPGSPQGDRHQIPHPPSPPSSDTGHEWAAAPTISRQTSAHRRHSSAQGPHKACCGAWRSHSSAHWSQMSAQRRHRDSARSEERLINLAASIQMSAQSWHSRIQRVIKSSWS
jgi:hypothetical protein